MKTLTPAALDRKSVLPAVDIKSTECAVRKYNEVLKHSPPKPTARPKSEAININSKNHDKTVSPKVRRHKALGRTTSAPVSIPATKNHHRHLHRSKKQVTRVSSASGATGLSPGGTHRITYERDFLLECRQSPLSLTPPSGLPEIPGATAPPLKRRSTGRKLVKTDSNFSTTSVTSVDSSSSFDVISDEMHHLEL